MFGMAGKVKSREVNDLPKITQVYEGKIQTKFLAFYYAAIYFVPS